MGLREWVGLEDIMLSEGSQVQKIRSHVFSQTWKIDPKAKRSNRILYKLICRTRLYGGTTLWHGEEGKEKRRIESDNVKHFTLCRERI
jgi:hypothetical protein